MRRKFWLRLVCQFLGLALVLFLSAGTLRWIAGWAFLAIYATAITLMSARLAKFDPALLAERSKIGVQVDQPNWDRNVMRILVGLIAAWLVVAGLDAVRFGLSIVPAALQVVGGVFTAASLGAVYLVMRQNSYLAPTVYIQRERGHTVVSTGAYSVVRHPFYAALIPFFSGAALLLGSWLSFGVSVLIAILFAVRSVREERHLGQELAGYSGYMQRVRRRLIPFIW